MKAIFNNQIIAESDHTEVVEGNHYFPSEAVHKEYFKPTDLHTTCPWKGLASYYTVEVNGEKSDNAAWYYPEPKDAAKKIKDYVAFYTSKVKVVE